MTTRSETSDMQLTSQRTDTSTAAMAAIIYPESFGIDDLLRRTATELSAGGWRVGGVVQSRVGADGCAGMLLEDLRTGLRRSIAQDLGKLSTSCKLDTSSVAEIAGQLERQVDAGIDLLVINRFGKLEFDGGGLRSVVERAVVADIPVLTAVRDTSLAAWGDFNGELGATLPPDLAAVMAWAEEALGRKP